MSGRHQSLDSPELVSYQPGLPTWHSPGPGRSASLSLSVLAIQEGKDYTTRVVIRGLSNLFPWMGEALWASQRR